MSTNYTQVSYGSSGDDVKTLQELLNQNGYSLDVDGVYGSKTQAAVKDYQQKNSLTVDGIVGNQTWSALTKASSSDTSTSSSTNAATNTAAAAPDYSQYSYDASTNTAYQQALAALQQATAAVPTYQASYDEQLQEIYDKIVNRDEFTYDLNKDALYQQYADQYQLMGQKAMMDTMGQAATLTGGYGNSFASAAGNQAYQAYLQQLNDVVPELYGMALDQYNAEGDKLLTQYSMLGDMADDEYGKYQDALNQYWQNVSLQKQNADDAYDRGYTNWLNAYQMGVEAENTAYGKQQDAYNNLVNLITSTGYTPTEAELTAAGMSSEQAKAYAKYYKKNNKSSSSSTKTSTKTSTDDGPSYNNGGYSSWVVKQAQKYVGATQDGKWGSDSAAKAKAKGYNSIAEVVAAMGQSTPTATTTSTSSTSKGFTGSTYSEAVAYIKANGGSSSGLMTSSEWARHKNSYDMSGQGGAESKNYSSYKAYLKDYVEYATGG